MIILKTLKEVGKMKQEDKSLKEYIRRDFYSSNIDKYRKYFDEWYDNLTDNQLYFWNKRMNGEIC